MILLKRGILLTLPLLLAEVYLFSQKLSEQEKERIRNYNYFVHDYKYLNNEFELDVPTDTFKVFAERCNFNPEKIRCYQDSLAVVLFGEFNTWRQRNTAHYRISFPWKKVARI